MERHGVMTVNRPSQKVIIYIIIYTLCVHQLFTVDTKNSKDFFNIYDMSHPYSVSKEKKT